MGFAKVAGGGRMNVPSAGILGSTLAVGSSVYLMENEASAEYMVVHQGIPSTLYDESCNGMWLMRKDLYESRAWHSSNVNDYSNSTIHSYLNSGFFNLFGVTEQSAIKQVKIPYVNGTGSGGSVASGSSGLSAKIFLLCGYELGWTQSNNSYFPIDGACLSYFSGLSSADSKRIGYLNGASCAWWLRSAMTRSTTEAWTSDGSGSFSGLSCSFSYGIRPALILPSTAKFDENTLLLKGVA